jgi:hypothetical protein
MLGRTFLSLLASTLERERGKKTKKKKKREEEHYI